MHVPMRLGDADGDKSFLSKLSHLHDRKGKLIVMWFEEPTEKEKGYFVRS